MHCSFLFENLAMEGTSKITSTEIDESHQMKGAQECRRMGQRLVDLLDLMYGLPRDFPPSKISAFLEEMKECKERIAALTKALDDQ